MTIPNPSAALFILRRCGLNPKQLILSFEVFLNLTDGERSTDEQKTQSHPNNKKYSHWRCCRLAPETSKASCSHWTPFEDQDKFRMSGLFRDVYILRRDKDHIRNFTITSSIEKNAGILTFISDKEATLTFNGETKTSPPWTQCTSLSNLCPLCTHIS